MKKVSCVLTALLIIAAFAGADIYIKSNVHTDAFAVMGQSQPASDTVSEQWIGDTAFAMISPDRSRHRPQSVVHINHKKPIRDVSPMDFAAPPPEMASMASMMKMTVTVNMGKQKPSASGNAGLRCHHPDDVMPMKMLVWATDNVPLTSKPIWMVYGCCFAQMR